MWWLRGNYLTEIKGHFAGGSFAGYIGKENWQKDGDLKVRTIESFNLIEVGPQLKGAYDKPQSTFRSAELSYENWVFGDN